jgi:Uma2 family endonuclease
VKALWVIDVNTLETHQFSQPGIDGYKVTKIIGPDETLVPDFAPELAVKLSELELI